jgi:hypothetical protein
MAGSAIPFTIFPFQLGRDEGGLRPVTLANRPAPCGDYCNNAGPMNAAWVASHGRAWSTNNDPGLRGEATAAEAGVFNQQQVQR